IRSVQYDGRVAVGRGVAHGRTHRIGRRDRGGGLQQARRRRIGAGVLRGQTLGVAVLVERLGVGGQEIVLRIVLYGGFLRRQRHRLAAGQCARTGGGRRQGDRRRGGAGARRHLEHARRIGRDGGNLGRGRSGRCLGQAGGRLRVRTQRRE